MVLATYEFWPEVIDRISRKHVLKLCRFSFPFYFAPEIGCNG